MQKKYVKGLDYFKSNRYHNAETQFRGLLKDLIDNELTDQPLYYYAIELLALSQSEQGKATEVSTLLLERLEIGKKQFGANSYDTANNFMTLAESFYREGKTQLALENLDKAETIYSMLELRYHDRLEFLEKNRAEYRGGPFDASKLPFDLSEFYSACESILKNEKYSTAEKIMSKFIEVGVEYKPTGMWADIFSNAQLTGVGKTPDHDKRIIYIPANSDSLKDEWCVVYTKGESVVSAFSHEG